MKHNYEIEIDNSYEASIKDGKWKAPGKNLYDEIMQLNDNKHIKSLLDEIWLLHDEVDLTDRVRYKTSYTATNCKYPHHVISKGKLVLSIPGVKAAYMRACQTGVIKDSKVKNHLKKHFKELNLKMNEKLLAESKIEENMNHLLDYLNISLNEEYDENELPNNLNEALDNIEDIVYNEKEYYEAPSIIPIESGNESSESLDNKSHNYFYHLIPKNFTGDKITSLEYQYHHDRKLFHKNSEKYRYRLCNGWNVYPNKDPDDLTDEEVYDGINYFRKTQDGCNQIYMFRYPPYRGLGEKMSKVLDGKDIYRIDLNDPRVKSIISKIDWGYVNSNTDDGKLTKAWYDKVTPEEYFSKYNENDDHPLFAPLFHISIITKDGYIPIEVCDKIDVDKIDINSMQAYDKNSNDSPYPDIMYFTSPRKFDKLNKKVFLTPYIGLSSIFCIERGRMLSACEYAATKSVSADWWKYRNINLEYDAWCWPVDELQEPLKSVNVTHNNAEWKSIQHPISGSSFGYIHKVDVSKFKDKLIQFEDAPFPDRECIYIGEEPLPILEIIPHRIRWSIEYDMENEERHGKPIIESKEYSKSFTEVKTPEELLKWMSPIQYGWIDKFGKANYDTNGYDMDKNYKLQSAEEVAKNKIGICWDQCMLEKAWFDQTIGCKIYFIDLYSDKYYHQTHSFVVYQENGKFVWFEHSWNKFRGIHKYSSLDDLIKDVKKKFSDYYKKEDKIEKFNYIFISEITDIKAGISASEYMKYAYKKGKPILGSNKEKIKLDKDDPINESEEIVDNIERKVPQPSLDDHYGEEIIFRHVYNLRTETLDGEPLPINDENIRKLVPIELGNIPNYMGINLCNVASIEWTELADNQLIDVTIHFNPAIKESALHFNTINDYNEYCNKVRMESLNFDNIYLEDDESKDNITDEITVDNQVDDSNKESFPKKIEKAESDKNGVRRKQLYIAFIEYAKKYDNRNNFVSIFDKDYFKISHPFVPDEMRFFYRLACPSHVVLAGNLTFYPVDKLLQINRDHHNNKLAEMIIFADTPDELRIFNMKDKKIYKGKEENNNITLGDLMSNSFDLYLQSLLGQGDILNGPLNDKSEVKNESNQLILQ